jgi:hypothetical protein
MHASASCCRHCIDSMVGANQQLAIQHRHNKVCWLVRSQTCSPTSHALQAIASMVNLVARGWAMADPLVVGSGWWSLVHKVGRTAVQAWHCPVAAGSVWVCPM